MKKPFIFGVAATGCNFTDRKKETEHLLNNFTHGVNTILISPRRWGKTSLVRKVSELAIEKNRKVVYMDIFACRTEQEFYQLFATNVLKQTSSKLDEWIETSKQFLAKISPKITIGTDPMNDFSLSFEYNPKDDSRKDILQLPEKIAKEKGIQIIICIDEFQQISEFDDSKNFQKQLRTVWQLQESTSYCLFGSKKHLMNELFEKKSLPFYKFGDVVYLPKIAEQDWTTYIREQFTASGKDISDELAVEICRLVDNHSSYVQQLAWLTWTHTDKTATRQGLLTALDDLLAQNAMLFQRDTENLSAYQMNFLKALADGVRTEFTTREIMGKYNLGVSSNVQRIKKSLEQKELVDISNRIVTLNDPVFGLWFRKEIQQKRNFS